MKKWRSFSTVLFAACLMAALVTRFWELDERPFSHDESVHGWIALQYAAGEGYAHSPVYHGPFLFHLLAVVFRYMGDTDFTARFVCASAGVLLTFTPFLFRKQLTLRGAWLATALLMVSPSVLYVSRYLRHDVFAALAATCLLASAWSYLERPRTSCLLAQGLAFAWLLTIKEVAFIYGFLFGAFSLGAWVLLRKSEPERAARYLDHAFLYVSLVAIFLSPFALALLGQNVEQASTSYTTEGAVAVALMLCISFAIGFMRFRARWLIVAMPFFALLITFFTSFFSNIDGWASAFIGSLGHWLAQHEVALGKHPWYYYFVVVGSYEFLPIALSLGAGWGLLRRRVAVANRPFVALLVWWTAGTWLIYSMAGERMPWLSLHFALPMCLLGGWFLAHLLSSWNEVSAKVLLMVAAILLATTARVSWLVNFAHPDAPTELMSYAQASQAMKRLTDTVIETSVSQRGDLSMPIGIDGFSHWPTRWYLRGFTNTVLFTDPPTPEVLAPLHIVLCSSYKREAVSAQLNQAWGGTNDVREITVHKLWFPLKMVHDGPDRRPHLKLISKALFNHAPPSHPDAWPRSYQLHAFFRESEGVLEKVYFGTR